MIFYLQNVSIWTGHNLRAQLLQVAGGDHIGSCESTAHILIHFVEGPKANMNGLWESVVPPTV